MFLNKLKEKFWEFIKSRPPKSDYFTFDAPNEFENTVREMKTPGEEKKTWFTFKIKF
jgi:hypothetical protein